MTAGAQEYFERTLSRDRRIVNMTGVEQKPARKLFESRAKHRRQDQSRIRS
jgi:hypothetical protein